MRPWLPMNLPPHSFALSSLDLQKTKVLSPSDEQEMIERLYKVKMLPEVG